MNILILSLVLTSVVSLLASFFTLNKLFSLMVEVEAFKKSTHSVQYVGASKQDIEVSNDIEKFQKEYLEEAQEKFPEFATMDDDLELRGL